MVEHNVQAGERAGPHPSPELVTVFRGSNSEAVVVKTALESRGFHPFLDGQVIPRPMVAGGNVFEVELKAPASEASAALESMRDFREAALQAPVDEVPWEREETVDPETERVGRKLRWASALFLGAGSLLSFILPLAGLIAFLAYFLYGINYIRLSRKSRLRPLGHRITMYCFSLVTIL